MGKDKLIELAYELPNMGIASWVDIQVKHLCYGVQGSLSIG